jgi:hypothetical protein
MSAAFKSALPVACLPGEFLGLAVNDAPVPLKASTMDPMAAKVVRTRPGCMGL